MATETKYNRPLFSWDNTILWFNRLRKFSLHSLGFPWPKREQERQFALYNKGHGDGYPKLLRENGEKSKLTEAVSPLLNPAHWRALSVATSRVLRCERPSDEPSRWIRYCWMWERVTAGAHFTASWKMPPHLAAKSRTMPWRQTNLWWTWKVEISKCSCTSCILHVCMSLLHQCIVRT